jgi:molybdopterin-binding protein
MELLKPRDAALRLGVSYPTVKQWIYSGKLQTVQTPGGHHRVPETEIARLARAAAQEPRSRRGFRHISGRNQLIGTVVDLKIAGLMAQIKLQIGRQQITSIITADAVREMGLKKGDTAAALIKSTEVMIVRP